MRLILEKTQNSEWDTTLHKRPTDKQLNDYHGEMIARCFPLQFPFGHSKMTKDPAVVAMSEQKLKKNQMKRDNVHVLEKYLLLQKPHFHSALFNLIVCNLIMKDRIFKSSRIHAYTKLKNGNSFVNSVGGTDSKKAKASN